MEDGIALEGWSPQESGTCWLKAGLSVGQWPWLGLGVKEHSSRCSDSGESSQADRLLGMLKGGRTFCSRSWDSLRMPPSVPCGVPLRANVYEVLAPGQDRGLNGAVRYNFLKTTGNRDWEYFTIGPISGLIQTAQRLDREKQAVYRRRKRRGPVPGRAGRKTFLWRRTTTSPPRMSARVVALSCGTPAWGLRPLWRNCSSPAHPGGQ